MEKILISACLLGDKTKYDGGDNYWPFVEKLKKKYVLIPFCPEVEGGLSVPRKPSEIQKDGSVLSKDGKDVTKNFVDGAEKAFQACRFFGLSIAILKDGSPSCGSRKIYDGSFKGNKIDGLGITARRLIASGIKVYSSTDNLEFLLGESEEVKERRKERNIEKEAFKKEEKAERRERRTRSSSSTSSFDEERTERKPSFRKKEYGDKRPFHKKPYRSYKKKEGFNSLESVRHSFNEKRSFKKPYGKPSFKKEGYSKEGYGNKDFRNRPYKKDGFKKDGFQKEGFHKDGYKKSYGEKSFGKRPYGKRNDSFHKDGFKKSYGPKKSFGTKKSYGERQSFSKGRSFQKKEDK